MNPCPSSSDALSASPPEASRAIHRQMIRLMIYLNRGFDPGLAWKEIGREPSFPQFKTLIMLHQIAPCTLKALADALGISAASASEMIERLVELGFVDRRQDQNDRRCVQVTLTPPAVRGVEKHEALILARLQKLMETLGPRPTQMWMEISDRLAEAMQQVDSAGGS